LTICRYAKYDWGIEKARSTQTLIDDPASHPTKGLTNETDNLLNHFCFDRADSGDRGLRA
jgi:hypothetical protein